LQDALILDLEGSVAPDAEGGRTPARPCLGQGGRNGAREVT